MVREPVASATGGRLNRPHPQKLKCNDAKTRAYRGTLDLMRRFTGEKKRSTVPAVQFSRGNERERERVENQRPGNILSVVVDDGEGETRPRRVKDRRMQPRIGLPTPSETDELIFCS